MDWKIELIAVPVADIDRAKAFYEKIGFHSDADMVVSEDLRFVQSTPPGSKCSIMLDKGIGTMSPGSLQAIQVVVPSADDALKHLTDLEVDARGVEDFDWGRFVYFADPDGNGWSLQELPDYSKRPYDA